MSGQRKRSRVTVQPSVEPVTLQELKLQLSINDNSFDAYLSSLIIPAREFMERHTGRKLISQEITMYLDSLGRNGNDEPFWNGMITAPESILTGGSWITLEWAPILSITQISSFSRANAETVMTSTDYRLDNFDDDVLARVSLNEGSVWPTDVRNTSGYKIVYQAGYGPTADDVPAIIRQAILNVCAYMFSNRGDCPSMQAGLINSGNADILNDYKIYEI